MNKKIFYLVTFVTLSATGYAYSISAPKSYEIQYLHSVGKMNGNGYVQIPKGGQKGTTSEERPTFKELNISRVYYPELAFTAKWDKFSMTLDGKYESFKGSSNALSKDLVTHDIFVPEGSSIRTKHKYAYYGLKFNYDYEITPKLTLTPMVGISLFDFSYQFSANDKSGNAIAKNDRRSFHSTMTTIGMKADYALNEKTKVILTMNSKLPFGNIKKYFDSSLLLSYNLYKSEDKELNVLGGVGYESLELKDSQKDMQNHMKHSMAPTYRVGLEYKF